jgi:hypothetical protein
VFNTDLRVPYVLVAGYCTAKICLNMNTGPNVHTALPRLTCLDLDMLRLFIGDGARKRSGRDGTSGENARQQQQYHSTLQRLKNAELGMMSAVDRRKLRKIIKQARRHSATS